MERRSILRVLSSALVACVALGAAAAPAPAQKKGAKGTDYAKDVAFLLDECEEKAGPLLAQKKIDWKAVRADFTKRAKSVEDDVSHVRLCAKLIARLRDGHAAFTKVDVAMPDEPPRFGVGLNLCESDGKVLVKQSFGPAAAAGISSGDEVLSIGGLEPDEWIAKRAREIADEHGFSTAHAERYAACHWGLLGEAGKTLAIEVEREKKGRKKATLAHEKSGGDARYAGPLFPDPKHARLGRRGAYGKLASGFGYVYLGEVAETLGAELDEALAALGDVPGLVIDMRANNGGGADHDDLFGRFVARGAKFGKYESTGKACYAGPIVVVVDAGTRSTGETLSGQLKEDGRAYMIGPSPTAGMSAQKVDVEVPSGLFRVRFATATNKGRFNGGKGIEGIGVPPHEIVPWDAKAMRAGIDPMIRRAEELLAKGFPAGSVRYEPPKRPK